LHGWRPSTVGRKTSFRPITTPIHRALLSGLLGNIGCKSEDSGHYLGARGIKFLIHPGSALNKKAGKWIAAAEITETTKLFARCVARIEPEWLEKVGAHLIKRSYFDPHWEKKAMQAVAFERSTLYGIVVNPKKRVNYGPMNPAEARELFIREGLVAGEIAEEYARRWAFYTHNHQLMLDIETLEHKSRRPDVLVDDELIVAFYDRIIPEGITNGADFDKWRKEAEREAPKLLHLQREDLMRHEAAGVTTEAFPHELKLGGVEFELSYHFEPGSPKDGVTITVPLAQLNQIPPGRCEWLVPGLLKEKVVQLVKTLPQKIRSKLVPVPEFAAEFVAAVQPSDKGLIPALIHYILQTRGLNARGWEITPDAFRPDALPAHFSFNFRLVDEHGRQLGMSRNLAELRGEWGGQAKQEFSEAARNAGRVRGHDRLELRRIAGTDGSRRGGRPARDRLPRPARRRRFRVAVRLRYAGRSAGGACRGSGAPVQAAVQGAAQVFREEPAGADADGHAVHGARFAGGSAQPAARPSFAPRLPGRTVADRRGELQAALHRGQAAPRADRAGNLPPRRAGADRMAGGAEEAAGFQGARGGGAGHRKQLGRLIGKRFIADTPFERLQHFPRYLKAVAMRLDKLRANPARDAQLMAEYAPLWTNYERRAIVLAKQGVTNPQVEQFRWLLEELRVQLFAQELRTPAPVSVKRLQKMWEAI
jgi:ATP-dependent helicase HrpA